MRGGPGTHYGRRNYREPAARAATRDGGGDRTGVMAGASDLRALAAVGKCPAGRDAADVQHGNGNAPGGAVGEVQEGAIGTGARGRESVHDRKDREGRTEGYV